MLERGMISSYLIGLTVSPDTFAVQYFMLDSYGTCSPSQLRKRKRCGTCYLLFHRLRSRRGFLEKSMSQIWAQRRLFQKLLIVNVQCTLYIHLKGGIDSVSIQYLNLISLAL